MQTQVPRRSSYYMNINGLHTDCQYGYKKHHSTETLLLKLVNDILVRIDSGSGVVLILIDLSAVFYTVDHSILL